MLLIKLKKKKICFGLQSMTQNFHFLLQIKESLWWFSTDLWMHSHTRIWNCSRRHWHKGQRAFAADLRRCNKATTNQWCRHVADDDGGRFGNWKPADNEGELGILGERDNSLRTGANNKNRNQRRDEQRGCQPWGLCNGVLSLCCDNGLLALAVSHLSASPAPPQEGLNVALQLFPRLSAPRNAYCPSKEVVST